MDLPGTPFGEEESDKWCTQIDEYYGGSKRKVQKDVGATTRKKLKKDLKIPRLASYDMIMAWNNAMGK